MSFTCDLPAFWPLFCFGKKAMVALRHDNRTPQPEAPEITVSDSSGKVVFENGAYRYDMAGWFYLRFRSSLVVGDGDGIERLTVIKKGDKYWPIDKPRTGWTIWRPRFFINAKLLKTAQ